MRAPPALFALWSFLLFAAVLWARPAGAPPPAPAGFPETALPNVGETVPTNAKIWLLGGSFAPETLVVTATADGAPVTAMVSRHACCLAEVDLGDLPAAAAVVFFASGETLDLDGSFTVGDQVDNAAPAPPTGVVLASPLRVRSFLPPLGDGGESGVEVQVAADLPADDAVLWVVLGDDDAWLSVSEPAASVYAGVPAAADVTEVCLRLAALDVAGNLSPASDVACIDVDLAPEPEDPPVCSCAAASGSPRASGLLAFGLAGLLARRRRR